MAVSPLPGARPRITGCRHAPSRRWLSERPVRLRCCRACVVLRLTQCATACLKPRSRALIGTLDHDDDVSVQVRRERGQPIHQFPRVGAHALSEATLAAPEQRHRYHGTIRAAGPLGRLGATVLEVAASEVSERLVQRLEVPTTCRCSRVGSGVRRSEQPRRLRRLPRTGQNAERPVNPSPVSIPLRFALGEGDPLRDLDTDHAEVVVPVARDQSSTVGRDQKVVTGQVEQIPSNDEHTGRGEDHRSWSFGHR